MVPWTFTDNPCETRLEVRYEPLELIDVKALADSCACKWYNETLCAANDPLVASSQIIFGPL